MRKILILLALLLVQATPSWADSFCDKAERKNDGEIVLKKFTVNGLKGIKACAYVDATTDQTYAALTDYASFPKWIDKVDKIAVEWPTPQTAMVSYTIGTLFGDFKYVLRRVHQKPFHVQWTRESGDFKTVNGAYTFIPIAGTSASYFIIETSMDPGVKMPGFIENYFQEKGSRRLVQDIRDEVTRRNKKQ